MYSGILLETSNIDILIWWQCCTTIVVFFLGEYKKHWYATDAQ